MEKTKRKGRKKCRSVMQNMIIIFQLTPWMKHEKKRKKRPKKDYAVDRFPSGYLIHRLCTELTLKKEQHNILTRFLRFNFSMRLQIFMNHFFFFTFSSLILSILRSIYVSFHFEMLLSVVLSTI